MPDYSLNPMAMDDNFSQRQDDALLREQAAKIDRMEKALDRENIARQFLYATGMFDSPAEIKANPDHRLVVIAYKAADSIRSPSGL